MKKHFKVALFALLGVLGYNANAQDSGFAVKAGLNVNTMNASQTKSAIGFNVGATYEFGIAENFSVEPGLFFDTRGYKVLNDKVNVYTLTLPVSAKYRIEVSNGINAVVNAGPFVNFNIAGKIGDSKIEFGGESGVKRFGAGLAFGVGIEVDNFIFGLGYDLGVTKIVKNADNKLSAFKIGVGYKF